MLNILINAYAIAPNWGSEQGMGWNWTINIAKFCRVHVITEGEWQHDIVEALKTLPQRDNLTFYFLPVALEVRHMCWNQGDYRFYGHYAKWQERALEKAREIMQKEKIDLIHQLNMVGFREPGQLWKIEGVPYVWGPFCGCLPVNLAYLRDMGVNARLKYALKNMVNWYQIRHTPKVCAAFRRADAVITTDAEIARLVKKLYGHDAVLMAETGLQSGCVPMEDIKKLNDGCFNLLWVGRFIKTKKLDIALQTIAELKDKKDIRLHVVGFGKPQEEAMYNQMAVDLGIKEMVVWHGKQDNVHVKELMRQMDVFFFTSVLEATSTVVPEAIQNRLPIMCHDICGFGPLIDNSIGRKIELHTPEQSVRDFTEKLTELYEHRELLEEMPKHFDKVARLLTYESKTEQMKVLYEKLCKK